jgi:hypothetical protein
VRHPQPSYSGGRVRDEEMGGRYDTQRTRRDERPSQHDRPSRHERPSRNNTKSSRR